jgi:hypothetical protein
MRRQKPTSAGVAAQSSQVEIAGLLAKAYLRYRQVARVPVREGEVGQLAVGQPLSVHGDAHD